MNLVDYDAEINYLLEKIDDDCLKAYNVRKLITALKHPSSFSKICSLKYNDISLDSEPEEDYAFEDEVSLFLEMYRELGDDFDEIDLLDILPSETHFQFENILLRLQAESLKEIKEIDEIISGDSELSEDELMEYNALLQKEKRKIQIVRELLFSKEESVFFEEEKNKIILVPTLLGNIHIIDELERVPKEFYSDFLELINSIEDGTFKGVKRFTNHRYLIGISEVRLHKARIVYSRIGRDMYALISAFVKKSNNDKLYRKSLISKVVDYKAIETTLLSKLDDESFCEKNDLALEQLYDLLLSPCKEKRLKL